MNIHFFKILILILFVSKFNSTKAQDLIVDKDNQKIFCKILKQDSVSFTVKVIKNNQPYIYEIKKSDVSKFYLSNNTANEVNKNSRELKKEHKTFALVGFNMGFSNPMNEFASQDLSDDKAGLAKLGRSIQGSLIIKLSSYLGVSAEYKFQQNKIDGQLLANALNTAYNVTNFKVSATPWLQSGFYGGLDLEIPIKYFPGLSLNFNPAIGNAKVTTPSYVTDGAPYGTLIRVIQFSDAGRFRSFSLKGGFNYNINSAIGLNVIPNPNII